MKSQKNYFDPNNFHIPSQPEVNIYAEGKDGENYVTLPSSCEYEQIDHLVELLQKAKQQISEIIASTETED